MNVQKNSGFDIILRAVACGLILAATMSIVRFDSRCDRVRDNILRLHIKANSDSHEDQQLKLKVRDAVLQVSEEIFGGCGSEDEAVKAASENLELLTETAQKEVFANGFEYPVTVSVGDAWFETREYESFTLPAGTYEAVRINIGEGDGKNWWCVMFPSLCIPSAKAQESLESAEIKEQEIVTEPERYVVRFKVVEVFEKIKNRFIGIFHK